MHGGYLPSKSPTKATIMLVKTYGAAVYGIDAATITIEVNLAQGINFFLVGLPDSAVKESQQRIYHLLYLQKYTLQDCISLNNV